MPLNRDALFSVNARAAVQSAYAALDGAQALPKPLQVAGFAVLFHETADALGLDPSQLLDMARRIRRDADLNYSLEARALRDYIQKELNA
ncbi:MAG: hypothetical protein GXC94_02230 [Comamonadaceae bacterium]|jgi:hypothetical protein|nr:hypothetical protein [Comamonadaceae bacterium]